MRRAHDGVFGSGFGLDESFDGIIHLDFPKDRRVVFFGDEDFEDIRCRNEEVSDAVYCLQPREHRLDVWGKEDGCEAIRFAVVGMFLLSTWVGLHVLNFLLFLIKEFGKNLLLTGKDFLLCLAHQ